ncbi:hypothetical protein PLICRDRAFT_174401 [Plicaturopsis crispa FD-325 SS-3]|nr:hypothetical protein PLICRDRAFT_174401 [Plicaturopsis crispa FD-325 SS-3]
MKFAFAPLASLAFLASSVIAAPAAGASLTINTPSSAVECQPTLLSWTGGTAPYFLVLISHYHVDRGNSPSSAPLEDLGEQKGTSYTWKTDVASGTSVGLTLKDSTGAIAQTAAFTIQQGSTSCVGK